MNFTSNTIEMLLEFFVPPLELDHNNAKYQIRSYTPGAIKINNQTLHRGVIVSANQLITDWPPQTATEITAELLQQVIALKPDILLIGTGGEHVILLVDVYGELINQGIGVEIMNTSAACRTFNALASENRQVVAALVV
jgi:uncharacterized protein